MSSEDETDVCLSQRNELSVPSEVMTAAGDADAAVAEFSHPHFVPTDERKFDVQVMVYNVAKRTNIGNMVRSAVAFGASAVIVIGNRRINTFGNQNTTGYIRFIHYATLAEAVSALHARDYDLVGVEIGNGARRLNDLPFRRSTCFMFGQEGSGLSPKQMAACDYLTYIPQYGKGTASLNVSNAAAIILHRFADWAGYIEQSVEGAKFVVDNSARVKTGGKPADGEEYRRSAEEEAVRAQRTARREVQLAAAAATAAGAAAVGADDTAASADVALAATTAATDV